MVTNWALQGETMMSDAIDIGNRKQLFIDNKWFFTQRGMTLTVNPPIKGEIVLAPEKPWEARALGAYSTIIEHGGKYKMWYRCFSYSDSVSIPAHSICYAESADGIHWDRPDLNLFEWEGIKENNIVMPGSDGGVMLDPNGPDEHRFKAVCNIKESGIWPESKGCVTGFWKDGKFHAVMELYLCTSPDGIHWTRRKTPVSDYFHDTHNHFFYDTRLKKYAAYLRTHKRGRTVARLEFDDPLDLPWIPLGEGHPKAEKFFPTVLTCDESDPPDTDLYTPCVHQYPWADDVYFSFTTPYRHYPVGDTSDTTLEGRDKQGRRRNDGPIDVQLAVSRDGVNWARPDRRPYVPLGLKGDYDGGHTYMCLGMIRKGNEIWMYDSPFHRTHGVWGTDVQPDPGLRRLVQRLDGFISADADYTGAEFTTPLLTFGGSRLELNVDCSALGQVWVEIRDEKNHVIPGYSLADSIDVDRNQIAAPVRWQERDNVADIEGRSVRLHFKLRACKLYAFQFTK